MGTSIIRPKEQQPVPQRFHLHSHLQEFAIPSTLQWRIAHLMNLPNFEYWKIVNFHCYVNVPNGNIKYPYANRIGCVHDLGGPETEVQPRWPSDSSLLTEAVEKKQTADSLREHKSKTNNSPCLTTLTNKETSKRFKKPFRNSRHAILALWGWPAAPG